jgi:hypothetical protein
MSPRRLFIGPVGENILTATIPITTHDIAVGKKITDRKNRQPHTCSWSIAAIIRGITIATGTDNNNSPLFSATRQNIGFSNSLTYVLGPIHVELIPFQFVMEE